MLFDSGPVRREHIHQAAGCGDRALGRNQHAFEEEGEPFFPVADTANAVQKGVVLATTFLEIQAQVEERLAQYTRVAEQECDQQSAYTPVAVQEGWMVSN